MLEGAHAAFLKEEECLSDLGEGSYLRKGRLERKWKKDVDLSVKKKLEDLLEPLKEADLDEDLQLQVLVALAEESSKQEFQRRRFTYREAALNYLPLAYIQKRGNSKKFIEIKGKLEKILLRKQFISYSDFDEVINKSVSQALSNEESNAVHSTYDQFVDTKANLRGDIVLLENKLSRLLKSAKIKQDGRRGSLWAKKKGAIQRFLNRVFMDSAHRRTLGLNDPAFYSFLLSQ